MFPPLTMATTGPSTATAFSSAAADGRGAGWFGDDSGPVVQPQHGTRDLDVIDGDDLVDEAAHVGDR